MPPSAFEGQASMRPDGIIDLSGYGSGKVTYSVPPTQAFYLSCMLSLQQGATSSVAWGELQGGNRIVLGINFNLRQLTLSVNGAGSSASWTDPSPWTEGAWVSIVVRTRPGELTVSRAGTQVLSLKPVPTSFSGGSFQFTGALGVTLKDTQILPITYIGQDVECTGAMSTAALLAKGDVQVGGATTVTGTVQAGKLELGGSDCALSRLDNSAYMDAVKGIYLRSGPNSPAFEMNRSGAVSSHRMVAPCFSSIRIMGTLMPFNVGTHRCYIEAPPQFSVPLQITRLGSGALERNSVYIVHASWAQPGSWHGGHITSWVFTGPPGGNITMRVISQGSKEEEEGLHGVFKRLRRNGHQLKKEAANS
jgi:hypothetical protein